jgi:mono/diheme cytochrome c family protein
MKRWLIRIALVLLGLVLLAATALFIAARQGEQKMQRTIELDVKPVPFRTDPAAIERGKYLFMSRGCTECHGVNGAGREFANDGKGLLIHAPNITPGPGGVARNYTELDWVRTMRHGVKPDGKPAFLMPSEDYARFTDDDLASLVAFMRTMPAAEGKAAVIELPLPVKALYAIGVITDAAEKIDHSLPPATPVPEAVSAQHGAYVANTCIGCHGAGLSGGKVPGAPPEWPAAANLTPGQGSAMGTYPDAQAFVAMMKTGKRPDGSAVSPVMPFLALKEMNDTDLRALYVHLKAVPARPFGQR